MRSQHLADSIIFVKSDSIELMYAVNHSN